MSTRVNSIVALLAILFLCISGCATYHYQNPAPAQPKKICIKVSEMGFTDKNIPVGVYRVPESPIIITGHQGKPGAYSAFGLLGMLTYVGTRSAKGENAVGDARNNLNIGIKNQIVSALEPLINEKPYNRFFTLKEVAENPVLLIEPAIVLTYVSETDLIPSVAFKVTLTRSGNKEWSAPYFCTQNIAKPLQGSNSWTDNSSAVLKQTIQENLSELVPVMLKDIGSPFPRDASKKILVKSHLPFRRNIFQLIGFKLVEDEHYIVFNPCISDYSCNAGINILRKNSISYRPARSDDPLWKEFDEQGPIEGRR